MSITDDQLEKLLEQYATLRNGKVFRIYFAEYKRRFAAMGDRNAQLARLLTLASELCVAVDRESEDIGPLTDKLERK